ncbi:MAG: hypothetical protein GY869_22760 [Planctomycetes bacterium]|nr:hypothetical protein [Planctomycetota bacterium]
MRDGKFAFNTSANFGYIWGYRRPEGIDRLLSTNMYYLHEMTKKEGGIQYFDAEGYGDDLFGFTTAAATQFQAYEGDPATYDLHLNWLMDHTNIYGSMPERVHYPEQTETGVAEASPLSWCNAELVMALLAGAETGHNAHLEIANLALEREIDILNRLGIELKRQDKWNLQAYVDTWTQCINLLINGDFVTQHAVSNLERIARNLAKSGFNLKIKTNFDSKDVTGQKEIIYGVEIENGPFDLGGAWRQRPGFIPEKFLWGVPQDLVTQDRPLLAANEIRVTEIEVQRLQNNLDFDWQQRVGLEYLLYVSENQALVYPAWIYLTGKPPLKVFVSPAQPGQAAILQIVNNCNFKMAKSHLAITGPFSTDFEQNMTIAGHDTAEVTIDIAATTPIGSYAINIGAQSPDGRSFEASTKLEVVRYIDLAGKWDFHAGDLTQAEQQKIFRHTMQESYERGRTAREGFDDHAHDRQAGENKFWQKWAKIKVPAEWEQVGYPDLDGVCWYRTLFNVNPQWQQCNLYLEVGAIDDYDFTYINGREVGQTEMWNKRRFYNITTAIDWQRPNAVCIKVIDLGYGGGMWKAPVRLVIKGR